MTDEQTLKLKYLLYELRSEGIGRAELEEELEYYLDSIDEDEE